MTIRTLLPARAPQEHGPTELALRHGIAVRSAGPVRDGTKDLAWGADQVTLSGTPNLAGEALSRTSGWSAMTSPPTKQSQNEAAPREDSSRRSPTVRRRESLGEGERKEKRDGAPRKAILQDPRVIAAVIGALALIAGAMITGFFNREPQPAPLSCDLPPGSEARACIETPQTNDTVGRNIVVDGKLAGIPDGSHVWVATRIGDLYWPKEPEVPIGPAFDVTVVEGGQPPDGEFSIVLLLVDAQRHQEIEEWINDGEGSGLRLGEGMQVLDSVAKLHLR